MSDSLTTSFLGSVQASSSVLLVLSYGVIAAQFELLDGPSSKKISTLCVRLFLPALLITNVGSQLHADTGLRYIPILSRPFSSHHTRFSRSTILICCLVWALFYTLTSIAFGFAVTRVFELPSWVTPALSFNNTTALPILLVESLQSTGILDTLLLSETDTSSAALIRAKSYFLVNAVVGTSLTFAVGPKLLDGTKPPEQEQGEHHEHMNGGTGHANGRDEEQGNNDQADDENPNEQTSLLPDSLIRNIGEAQNTGYKKGKKQWEKLPSWTQSLLKYCYSFLNAPLIGATIGAILGLIPPLHKVFFNKPQQGGIFSAWLTDSVKKIGSLFAALTVVVVGVKLSSSLRKMKRGEDSGDVPWIPTVSILLVRFIVWPA